MSVQQQSLAAFWNRFTAVERRSRALGKRFGTIQLYAIQRTRIFYAIATEIGLFDDPHPNFSKPESHSDVPGIASLERVSTTDNVVIPFRRRVGGEDPYSAVIVDHLRRIDASVSVIDFSPQLEQNRQLGIAGEDLDLERLRAFFAKSEERAVSRIMRFTSRRPQVIAWQKIIASFELEFGITLEKFKKYPQWLVRRTLAEQRGFAKLFRAKSAKNLFIVNAYSEPSIVLGARKAKLVVHEIQHGFISKYHPAYSFDSWRGRLDAAPDELLTWGSFWGSTFSLARGTRTRVTGPTAQFRVYRDLALSENRVTAKQVLFSSQGAIAAQLFKAAFATAQKLPDHHIIYRLHPNESLAEFESQLDLANRSLREAGIEPPKNFSLSHRDPIFLDLVSQSEYLIGAFSTTLFEGLALGCKVLVLPIAGFENVQPAIDAGDITLITNLDDLPATLRSARKAENPEKYYAREADV